MKFAAYLLAGIGLGVGLAFWQLGGGDDPSGSSLALDRQAPIDRRLSELETALAFERYEREVLAEQLSALNAMLEELTGTDADLAGNGDFDPRERIASLLESEDGDNPIAERVRQRFPDGFPGQRGFDESVVKERQINRFIEAGFAPERAQWLVEREDELEMEVLQARYELTQNGADPQEIVNLSTSALMREELGDVEYEQYLEGLGRPTSVNIRNVLTNSPAQAAGLQAGDEIIAYDGQRVFDMNELTGLTYEGNPGEAVAIEILRDGQPMQLYVERGPIGVSGGGRASIRRMR